MSAIKQDAAGSPYRVPPEPNRWPAIGLAVGVHALLLAFLYVGVSWQTTSPVTVEAEVWDMKTEMAAPPPPPPAPEPEPEPEPETPPPPQPAPRAVEPPPPPVAKVEPKAPDIALEQKKRKEELKRKEAQAEADRQERERERERELAEQKRADDKKAKALADKKERELADKKEREAEKKAEQLAKQEQAKKDEADKKKKADKEKTEKLAKEKAAKEKAEKAEAAQLAKLASMSRADETKRLTTGNGNPNSTGSAEKSTAPRLDAGYSGKIAALIKSNTSYAGSTDVPGNPMVSFRVEQLPTGEIVSVKKVKSSGIPEFDDAVERGIKKTETLPKKKDGTVERSLSVDFKLKEMK